MSHPPSQGPDEGPQPHGSPQDGQAPQGPPEGAPPQGPPPQGPPQGHPAGPYQPGPPPPPPGQPPYGHPQGGHPYAPGQSPYGPGQPPYGPGQPPYGPGQPPYGQQQPPGQGGGMSKGAKIGLIGGAAALAVVLVAAVVVVATDPFSSDEPASASAEDEEGAEEEDGTDGSDDDTVTGGGPGAEVYEGSRNELIELDEPLTGPRFMSIESDGTVTVELRDAAGDQVDQVNSHYTGSGGKAPYNHRAEQEIAQLDVRSDEESWSISDEPLENADSWDDPDEPLEGSGPDVVLIDWESTDVEVEMEHSGESNFAIWAHNTDDLGFSDLLVNEIGDYSGSESMSEDTTFLHIEGDGDWTITPS